MTKNSILHAQTLPDLLPIAVSPFHNNHLNRAAKSLLQNPINQHLKSKSVHHTVQRRKINGFQCELEHPIISDFQKFAELFREYSTRLKIFESFRFLAVDFLLLEKSFVRFTNYSSAILVNCEQVFKNPLDQQSTLLHQLGSDFLSDWKEFILILNQNICFSPKKNLDILALQINKLQNLMLIFLKYFNYDQRSFSHHAALLKLIQISENIQIQLRASVITIQEDFLKEKMCLLLNIFNNSMIM